MKIHVTTGVERNFGDELNGWMWSELFPTLFEGAADGVNFIGIGTILDERLPVAGLNVVLGSGTGYARAPDVRAAPSRWRIYGVRGPLTARMMGLPDSAVLADPAVLLADHPRWKDRAERAAPAAPGPDVVFVPHWKSVRFGQWPAACRIAGLEFIDPRDEARTVVDRIAGARLVVAESMHAAIVADALRVPWIPIVLSREVSPFKWTDWAATAGVEYTPLLLAPSCPLEALRARVLMHSSFAHIDAFHDQARRAVGPRELGWTREQLLGDHARLAARSAQAWRRGGSVLAEALLKRAGNLARAAQQRFATGVYRRYREEAVAQLRAVLRSPPRLSSEATHQRALQRCHDAVGQLTADYRAGCFAAWRPDQRAGPRLTAEPAHGMREAADFALPLGER